MLNELHEASDVVRFKLCDTSNMTAQELYTLMVYGEDEVYTSSFLGLFKRLMERMTEESSYEFLHNLGRNQYRTFIKMCAAYNELPTFLNKIPLSSHRAQTPQAVRGIKNRKDSNLQKSQSQNSQKHTCKRLATTSTTVSV